MAKGQTNLEEMKRIYRYLSGKKGCSLWVAKLKELFPEAKRETNAGISYHFDVDKVWEVILQNNQWKAVLEKRRISDYWELSYRATPDDADDGIPEICFDDGEY